MSAIKNYRRGLMRNWMTTLTMDENRDSNNDNDVSVSDGRLTILNYNILIDDVSKYVAMLCLYIIANHFLAVSLYHQVIHKNYWFDGNAFVTAPWVPLICSRTSWPLNTIPNTI